RTHREIQNIPLGLSQIPRLVSLTDDARLAAWIEDSGRAVHVVDTASGRATGVLAVPVKILDFAFSPGGRWLAAVGVDSQARIWEVATARLVHTIRLKNPDHRVGAVSPRGDSLILSDHPYYGAVAEYRVDQSEPRILEGIPMVVSALTFSP